TVTEKEIQWLGETLQATPRGFDELRNRCRFLAASRFLEDACQPHVLWRRVHTESEGSPHLWQAAEGGEKSPGNDLLLLEAARRALEDQVPDLHRLFVTSDRNLARAAAHTLQHDAFFVAYQRPFPAVAEITLSPYLWWGEIRRAAFRPNAG